MLANYLTTELVEHHILRPKRARLDITDTTACAKFLDKHQIQIVINCAGIAHGQEEELFRINALAPGQLAKLCAQRKIIFIFLSSGRVFNGKCRHTYHETSRPDPIDRYGLSKFMGEKLVALHAPNHHLIIRLPMLLGLRRKNPSAQVLFRLLQQATESGMIRVATDVFHSPVHCRHVAQGLAELIHQGRCAATYHLSSGERLSLAKIVSHIMTDQDNQAKLQKAKSQDFSATLLPRCQALASKRWPHLPGFDVASAIFQQEIHDAALY